MAYIYEVETDELTKLLLQDDENRFDDLNKRAIIKDSPITKGNKNGKSNAKKHQKH